MTILCRRNLSISAAVSILTAALLLVAGCKSKTTHSAAAPTPPAVVVAPVTQRTVPIYSEYVGQTQADNTVELRARRGRFAKGLFPRGRAG